MRPAKQRGNPYNWYTQGVCDLGTRYRLAASEGACGHLGASVKVRKVPVTGHPAACDLTGVVISYPGYGGATVPDGSGGIGTSSGFTLEVHPGTLDVTVDATGPPGNA